MDWQLPLIVATAVFLAFIVFRLRPVVEGEGSGQARADLKAAKKRIEEAKTDAERVEALCAAGDASAKLVSGGGRAVQLYLRAMKLAPSSAEVVDRAAKGMARRPRGLENLLWRRLGAEDYAPKDVAVLAAVLTHMGQLYAGPLKSSVRARAFHNMLNMMAAKAKT